MCVACYNFAGRTSDLGDCGACRRRQLLKRGYCRLCWQQAALERPTGPNTPLAPYLRRLRHQQLFLADMNRRRAAPRAFPRRYGAKGRPHKPPPPPAGPVEWAQLPLFETPRAYRYGRLDLRRGPAPDNPWLAWALHLAHARAEARGFDPIVRCALNRNLVMLLADYRGGEPIRSSAFHAVLRDRGASIAHTSDVLEQMGILLDDRLSTFETWLAGKLDGLTPGIRSEVERWTRTLRDGGPRSWPRSESTARNYLHAIRPLLLEWSELHQHLREITRDHILAAIGELYGHERHKALLALRSLFNWATRQRVVFRNPTSRIKLSRLHDPVWQPLSLEEITRTIEAATTPQAHLSVALAAVHAARPGAIRALTLDDIDLGNRRLTIAGRSRPLDEFTPTPSCASGSTTAADAGPTPPTRTCSSALGQASVLGRSARPGSAACLRRWSGCGSTGSSRKHWQAGPTRSNWPPSSRSAKRARSATPPTRGSSCRRQLTPLAPRLHYEPKHPAATMSRPNTWVPAANASVSVNSRRNGRG
ncbi:MAG: tyrosine-type recombinase/integrase [Gaiellaceae bacterium]